MIPGSQYLPSLPQVTKETIAVLIATLAAAYVISRFPAVARFVGNNSVGVTVSNPGTVRLDESLPT